ncbi:MAG: NAD(P)H-hydrate dehydratase [Ignavibacteria bacterium]
MIPLFSVSQVRDADNYAINELQIPGLLLMENASRSIFDIVKKHVNDLPKNRPLGFVCGKGNNGGDGFAVARHFINDGYTVKVIYLAGKDELSGDALINFELLLKSASLNNGNSLKKFAGKKDLKLLDECYLIFDAMLGTGSKGELKEPYLTIVKELNSKNALRIAIDIPAGLDADTGYGSVIFNAELTISLCELKRGLFINKGAVCCGHIERGYIGAPESYFDKLEIDEYIIEPEDILSMLPVRAKDSHKYSVGKVLVVAGSAELPGASILTAVAALKSGAGACFLAAPSSIRTILQCRLSEVIVHAYDDEQKGYFSENNIPELMKRFEWMDCLAIGPGLGRSEETLQAVRSAVKLNNGKRMVIDADAIFALSNEEYKYLDLANAVFTPHHAEFAYLLGIELTELRKDLLRFGKEFALETGAYLVLKGAPTIIFNPMGEAFINHAGNPGMAKFGTGDALTGVIAAMLSQTESIEDAVLASVYLHSLSADLLLNDKTEFGIMAAEIINNLPDAINFLRKSYV